MNMINPAVTERGETPDAEVFAEAIRGIWQKIADRHGHHSANMMWRATQAMLDHMTGHRGITMKTWQRYVGMLLEDPDASLTVWYRLQNKAHWSPAEHWQPAA